MKLLFPLLLALALAGCVQVNHAPLPADWPPLVALAQPAGLNGRYEGPLREMSLFASVFFPPAVVLDGKLQFLPAGFRITATADTVIVEALRRDGTVLAVEQRPARRADGGLLVERRTAGREGLSAATYRDAWLLQPNAAGELVVRHVSASAGILFPVPVTSQRTAWWRLQRSAD